MVRLFSVLSAAVICLISFASEARSQKTIFIFPETFQLLSHGSQVQYVKAVRQAVKDFERRTPGGKPTASLWDSFLNEATAAEPKAQECFFGGWLSTVVTVGSRSYCRTPWTNEGLLRGMAQGSRCGEDEKKIKCSPMLFGSCSGCVAFANATKDCDNNGAGGGGCASVEDFVKNLEEDSTALGQFLTFAAKVDGYCSLKADADFEKHSKRFNADRKATCEILTSRVDSILATLDPKVLAGKQALICENGGTRLYSVNGKVKVLHGDKGVGVCKDCSVLSGGGITYKTCLGSVDLRAGPDGQCQWPTVSFVDRKVEDADKVNCSRGSYFFKVGVGGAGGLLNVNGGKASYDGKEVGASSYSNTPKPHITACGLDFILSKDCRLRQSGNPQVRLNWDEHFDFNASHGDFAGKTRPKVDHLRGRGSR